MCNSSMLKCYIVVYLFFISTAEGIWQDQTLNQPNYQILNEHVPTSQRRLLQDDKLIVRDPSVVFVVRMYNVSCSDGSSPFQQQVLDLLNVGMGCSGCASMLGSVCPPTGGVMEVVMVSQVGNVPYPPMQNLVNTAIIAPQCILGDLMQKEGDINLSIMHVGKFTIPDSSTPSVLIPLIDGCNLPGTQSTIGMDAAKKSVPLPSTQIIPEAESEDVEESSNFDLAQETEATYPGDGLIEQLQEDLEENDVLQFGQSSVDLTIAPQLEQTV
eukprot:TRINITY_DN477_c0_g2_i1.p4 TRINITY_DN477_c0_g2~~TRINITY_DN477_c0_g2_i1.p4  ORF type:complete len:270 (-),score=37.12 TRINITY_DN477_c0_g2_i1:1838-2647(-)